MGTSGAKLFIIGISVGMLFSILMAEVGANSDWGSYRPYTEQIYIRGWGMSVNDIQYTAQHEIAHHVWYDELGYGFRSRYKHVALNSDEYVTPYAEKNEVEDFAETIAFATQCKINLNRVPEDRRGLIAEAAEVWG